jgi:hypothetical protein
VARDDPRIGVEAAARRRGHDDVEVAPLLEGRRILRICVRACGYGENTGDGDEGPCDCQQDILLQRGVDGEREGNISPRLRKRAQRLQEDRLR